MTEIIRPDCHEAVIRYVCFVWLCSLRRFQKLLVGSSTIYCLWCLSRALQVHGMHIYWNCGLLIYLSDCGIYEWSVEGWLSVEVIARYGIC